MKYNLYQLKGNNVKLISYENVPKSVESRLTNIENSIIELYLQEQEGSVGIKKLGNKIRYDSNIQEQFNFVDDQNNVLIKLTENRRSFKHVLIESFYAFHSSQIFFLILEDEFGKDSRLVDKSFIKIEEIKEEINKFFSFFKPEFDFKNLCFIEFKGFDNYRIETIDEYSKIHCDE